MERPANTRLVFEDQLKAEAERVLSGLVFRRSPVQSQLLRFLLKRTLEGGTPPTQFEIAVDGLGKDADFDLASDSYPRVQVSRLRSNLDSYYSRQAPGNGLRLTLETGTYRLDLGKVKSPASIARVASDPPTRAPEAPAFPSDNEPTSHSEAAPSSGLASPLVPWLLSAIALLVCLIVYTSVFSGEASIGPNPTEKPSVALIVKTQALPQGDQTTLDRVQVAARLAEVQMAYSWVTQPNAADAGDDADYTLVLDFARPSNRPLRAFVELTGRGGDILFSDRVVDTLQEPQRFSQELTAAMVFITAPTGIIASDRMAQMGDTPQNGYECFLQIENIRADGHRSALLVDSCLKDFPDSEYRPFLLARRSFTTFQRRIVEGLPLERSGPAWDDLQNALDLDRFNAFANFTAAKVELANGNCEGASGYIRNAFERAVSYPAMIVAIEASTTSCPDINTRQGLGNVTFETIVRANPAPDPLLHLYLLLGLVGNKQMDDAEALARRLPLARPEGLEQQAIARLQRAITDKAFAEANRDALREEIGIFIWGDAGVERVIDNLTASDEIDLGD